MRFKYEITKVLDNGYESAEKGEISSDKNYHDTYVELLDLAKEVYGECMLDLTIISDYAERWERMKSMMMQKSIFAA
jgi:hypothetical protein